MAEAVQMPKRVGRCRDVCRDAETTAARDCARDDCG
jgi:hypothetical protein